MTSHEKRIRKLINNPQDVSIQELQTVLANFGWSLIRTKGSHFIFKDLNGRIYSVPVHNSKIKSHYIKDILKILYGNN